MDLLVCCWSESHHEVKVKYLTLLMFVQAKAVDVVKDMIIALETLAVPIKLMVHWVWMDLMLTYPLLKS